MEKFLKNEKPKVILLVSGIAVAVGLVVMMSWLFNIRQILSLVPEGATMKFNTALSFFLAGISLAVSLLEERRILLINKILQITIFLIALITLLEYLLGDLFHLDTLLADDPYSGNMPGRMSPATAFSFLALALSFWGIHARKMWIKLATQYILLVIMFLSLVAIVSYFLLVPGESKILFFNSMAFHTAFLFLLLAAAASLKNHQLGFTGMFFGEQTGSNIMRFLLPFLVLFPVGLSFTFLKLTQDGLLAIDFGIVLYTVIFIFFSIIYVSVIASGLNRNDLERLRLEASLRETNQELSYFQQALDKSSIVAITDARGILTYVNDAFCEISRYKREELIGKTHKIINSGYHSKEFFQDLWETIRSGRVWTGEIKNQAKDGTHYWLHTSIVPFRNESGRVYQYLAIRQDITRRKKAEALLSSQYVQKLEQKNKELEQFAYIASHDLQEPLRTLTNSVLLLEEEYSDQLDDEALRCIDYMGAASARMRELIKGLLDYSRIGREKELSTFRLNDLIIDLMRDLDYQIQNSDATFDIGDLPEIHGYKIEIRLLFQNLISNAIKFRKPEVAPHVKIRAVADESYWQFSVADNGIGIEEEYADKIFLIFQRLHNRSQYEGTGIGLSHCQKIVEIHGGRIWVKSEPGEGSTFYFTIPIEIHEKKTELHLIN